MKKYISYALIFLFVPSFSFGAIFTDTELSYYRDSINVLSTEWIISWYGDGRFGPDNTITRAEIVKILLRAKWVSPSPISESCFSDVKSNIWYHSYICEAVKLWVVKGFADGTFKPNNPVTILEALAMSMRLFGIAPESGTPWYTNYQNLADTTKIIDTESYNIHTVMTRGKAANLILRVREYASKKAPLTNLSKGCESPKSLTSGTHEVTIAWKTRSYILAVPGSYSSTNPAKLIIALHGRTNSNSMVQDYMGLEWGGWRWPGQSDFIVAYPAALRNGSSFTWSSEENVTLVDTIIRDVTDSLCVDRGNIHVVAHSMGAWFASKLSCVRGDIFRGMAIVGGGGYTSNCNNTPTASLIYQNDNDRLSPAATARTTESKMKSVNLCSNEKESTQIGDLSCDKWKDCSSWNPVIYCKGYSAYGGDPHSWPTGGGTAMLEWMRGF